MQELEIEKRFLIKQSEIARFLALANQSSRKYMNDFYVPNGNQHKDLRLRQKGDSYVITRKRPLKDGDSIVMLETTIPLSLEEFQVLSGTITTNVEKERYRITVADFAGELDILQGRLQGLAFLEFEFPSQDALKTFENQFHADLIDVTGLEWLASGRLAETSFAELQPRLQELF